MTVWWGLFKKELLEISRDRRALISGFALAFLAPLVIYGSVNFAIRQASSTPPAWIDVVNPEAAPAVIELLAEAKIYDINTSDDPDAPSKGRLKLIFGDDFLEAIARGQQAEVTLRGELRDDAVEPVFNRVRRVMREFSSSTAGVRLLMRGLDPSLMQPITIHEQNTAPASNNAGQISMIIVFYVMMAAFFSALSSAIDTSAGERERNVLEVLLIQPVKALDIVTAKISGVFLVSMVGVTLTLAGCALAMNQVELEKVGLSFSLAPLNFIAILLVMVPLALMAAALQLLVAYFSKTFKEAQQQVSLVIMVPAMAPLALAFMPDPPDALNYAPLTGQFLFLEEIFSAGTIDPMAPLVASGLTVLLAVLMIALTAKQLSSERSVNSL